MPPAIEIAPYDPAWAERFTREAERLRGALGAVAVRIDHVGSTSVPGLAAKPVIDIQISVRRLEPMTPYRAPLEALGYTFLFDPEFPDYPFFHLPAAHPHTHHIHLCEVNGLHERRHLAFRDYLRAHPETVAEYEALKRRLAPQFDAERFEEREAYCDAKSAFIQTVERRALQRRPVDTS